MAARAHKTIRNTDLTQQLPVMPYIQGLQQVENYLHALERKSMDSAKAAAQSFGHLVGQSDHGYGQMFANPVKQMVQSLCHNLQWGQRMAEYSHRTASELMKLSQEALDCRSSDELYNVNRQAAGIMIGWCLEQLDTLNAVMFNKTSLCVLPPD